MAKETTYALLYGLPNTPEGAAGGVLCRLPPGLNWRKQSIPALQSVAKLYGGSLTANGKGKLATCYLGGETQAIWDANTALPAYDYQDGQMVKVKGP